MNKTDLSASTTEISYQEKYKKLEQDYLVLKDQLAELRRLIFGSKSERFVSNELDSTQLTLFESETIEEQARTQEQITYLRKKSKDKQVPIRATLPNHLPRVEEVIEPESIAANAVKIGEQITEILEYNPAKVFVRKIVRPKYAIKDQNKIAIAELPSLPLPKANAGSSLLAHILVSKYVDHLPFYRQRQIFKRQDGKSGQSEPPIPEESEPLIPDQTEHSIPV